MKGKIGLVVGLGAGYVLGTRAGRERYEQIKTQWLKVWNLDPVQKQVANVSALAKSQAAAVPGALWSGAVKVIRSVGADGTPGEKLDSALKSGKEAAADVAEAVEETVADVKDSASESGSSTKANGAGASSSAAKASSQNEK
jgi:hypothetical protein